MSSPGINWVLLRMRVYLQIADSPVNSILVYYERRCGFLKSINFGPLILVTAKALWAPGLN